MERTINHHALKELKDFAGLTGVELATRAGISQNYLSEIEAGKKNPSPRVVRRLADALQLRSVLALYCTPRGQLSNGRRKVG